MVQAPDETNKEEKDEGDESDETDDSEEEKKRDDTSQGIQPRRAQTYTAPKLLVPGEPRRGSRSRTSFSQLTPWAPTETARKSMCASQDEVLKSQLKRVRTTGSAADL